MVHGSVPQWDVWRNSPGELEGRTAVWDTSVAGRPGWVACQEPLQVGLHTKAKEGQEEEIQYCPDSLLYVRTCLHNLPPLTM